MNHNQSMEDAEDKKFHIEKSISYGNILMTISFVIATFWYIAKIEVSIQAINQEITHVKEIQTRDRTEIQRRLEKIDKNLQKVVEEFIYKRQE